MNRRLAVLAGMLLVPLALVAAVCGNETTRIETPNGQQANGISVTGEGKVTAKPDLALITLGVSALAPTVAEARDQAATSLDAMIASMKDNGIEEDDIQTQQLSIYPEYDYNGNTQTLRGFRVQNTVSAKLRDIDRTGEVVDDAVNAGGDNTQIQGIAFTIDDPKLLQEQARRAAIEDARAKAQTLAGASGVDIGEPIVISEGGGVSPPVYYERSLAGADAAQAAPETPIETGELDVIIYVTVTWAIQ